MRQCPAEKKTEKVLSLAGVLEVKTTVDGTPSMTELPVQPAMSLLRATLAGNMHNGSIDAMRQAVAC